MKAGMFESFDRVLVRNGDNTKWKADKFSHYNYDDDVGYRHACISGYYLQCIPYEGNEHLVGTTNAPEEPETFEFGDTVEVRDGKKDSWKAALFIQEYEDDPFGLRYKCILKETKEQSWWKQCRKLKE